MSDEPMSFKEALKILNIEDFGERIWHSNSTGELFHCYDYINQAKSIKDPSWYRPLFLIAVEFAEKNWTRPESVFQHMPTMMMDIVQTHKESERQST